MKVKDKLFNRVIDDEIEKEVEAIAKQYAGINLEDLPQLEKSPEDLTEEEYNQLKGKAWISYDYLLLPMFDIGFVSFTDDGIVTSYIYSGSGESFSCESYDFNLNEIGQGGTKLYKHVISIGVSGSYPQYSFTIISNNGNKVTNTSELLSLFSESVFPARMGNGVLQMWYEIVNDGGVVYNNLHRVLLSPTTAYQILKTNMSDGTSSVEVIVNSSTTLQYCSDTVTPL